MYTLKYNIYIYIKIQYIYIYVHVRVQCMCVYAIPPITSMLSEVLIFPINNITYIYIYKYIYNYGIE